MAEGKRSFLLYVDFINVFQHLSNEEAGILIKHIFEYVNDKDPVLEDRLLNIAFEPIKQQLKRDLGKWQKYIEKQSFNGKKGGRPSKATETQKTQAFFEKPKKADNVNVNVNDNVTVINDNSTIKEKKKGFVKPGIDDVVQYFLNQEMPKSEAERFFDYYESNGWKVGKNKMKSWEAAARNWKKNLNRYAKNRENFGKHTGAIQLIESLRADYHAAG